jgi:hypothetical protein
MTRLDPLDYFGVRGEGSIPVPLPPPVAIEIVAIFVVFALYHRMNARLGPDGTQRLV